MKDIDVLEEVIEDSGAQASVAIGEVADAIEVRFSFSFLNCS